MTAFGKILGECHFVCCYGSHGMMDSEAKIRTLLKGEIVIYFKLKKCPFIYHTYHTWSHGGLQFCTEQEGEIGHQHTIEDQ